MISPSQPDRLRRSGKQGGANPRPRHPGETEQPYLADQLRQLDLPDPQARLRVLAEIYRRAVDEGRLPVQTEEVNNHVHTCYSFSPYNPTQAAYMAWRAGLKAVGIMDHDSFAGSAEMVQAGQILELGTTCGVELRVSAAGTELEGRSLNNPDSAGIFYMAIHGIPQRAASTVADFLAPIQAARNLRNRRQVEALNDLVPVPGLRLEFQSDVAAWSQAAAGGSITERHILAALARKIVEKSGIGAPTVEFLQAALGLAPPPNTAEHLADPENPHYIYDLIGLLKSEFLPKFFIQPGPTECIPARTAVDFARSVGAIPAYAYLGDVGNSPTGDKRAQAFEDSFLDDLLPALKDLGFLALTFMPPRNSLDQLTRLMALCDTHGLMQISGVDINSSRQSFSCPEVLLPEFRHLNRSTWALVAHERLCEMKPEAGLFGSESLAPSSASLQERIEFYARLGERAERSSA